MHVRITKLNKIGYVNGLSSYRTVRFHHYPNGFMFKSFEPLGIARWFKLWLVKPTVISCFQFIFIFCNKLIFWLFRVPQFFVHKLKVIYNFRLFNEMDDV